MAEVDLVSFLNSEPMVHTGQSSFQKAQSADGWFAMIKIHLRILDLWV